MVSSRLSQGTVSGMTGAGCMKQLKHTSRGSRSITRNRVSGRIQQIAGMSEVRAGFLSISRRSPIGWPRKDSIPRKYSARMWRRFLGVIQSNAETMDALVEQLRMINE